MKILFCSPNPVKQELGASRVLIGVATGLSRLGWECHFIGPAELTRETGMDTGSGERYAAALRILLQREAAKFEVVEYDQAHLPYARTDFFGGTLFVARSVLLAHHFGVHPPPTVMRWWQRAKHQLLGEAGRELKNQHIRIRIAHVTLENADLINVANEDDRRVLMESGIEGEKIAVVPYGLDLQEMTALATSNPPDAPRPARICFLGTFDGRKGAGDLPQLTSAIARARNECVFRLIGTAGLYQTARQVLAFFPRTLRPRIEVVPRFTRRELPALLDGCAVGVFPSYIEGFGFGVLEMLAAGVPVVGYRRPGPPMMLDGTLLVPAGDVAAMAAKVVALLDRPEELRQMSAWARKRAREFSWDQACDLTDRVYRNGRARLLRSREKSYGQPFVSR